MIRTRFTDGFDVDAPVVSAPMAMHSSGPLAAAVSAGGGLGTFGGTNPGGGPDWMKAQIEHIRARTDKPFGVGFITHFLPFTGPLFDAALEAQVPVVALSFAPAEPWLSRAHAAGARVICQVQTLELARDAIDSGADAIAVQGNEAGGHTGAMGLLPFLTQVLDFAGHTPVLAAGGVANGRALAAVLAAGADGVWMGTPFLAATEAADIPAGYKNLIIDSDGQDTVFTSLFDQVYGVPNLPWPSPIAVRMHRNPLVDEWAGREASAAGEVEALRARWPAFADWKGGFDPDRHPVLYGQSAGSVSAIRPAADIIADLVSQAEGLLVGGSGLVSDGGHSGANS